MNEKYLYRFKTKKEFEQEFGENWRDKACLDWIPPMDRFFGQVYPFVISHPFEEKYIYIGYCGYHITYFVLTLNVKPIPNYKPKKFDRHG